MFNPLKTRSHKKGTLANIEDLYVAFSLGLHCLLRQNQSSEIEIQYSLFEIMSCDYSIYAMDHSDFIVCKFMEIPFV